MENNQISVPNSTAVLVLGIISIPTCACFGIVGLACGVIALILASKANKTYALNPEGYTSSSMGNLKAGKICAIIGVVLSGLYLLYVVAYIALVGTIAASLPWEQMNRY